MATVEAEVIPDPSTAIIKEEFIVKTPVRVTSWGAESAKENSETCQPGEEVPAKKIKLSKKERKLKGQNKNRGVTYRVERETEFCPYLLDTSEGVDKSCKLLENCVFKHNFSEYLADKPSDLGDSCYVFNIRGHCPRGITCRYGKQHLTTEGKNIVDSEKLKEWSEVKSNITINDLTKDLQVALRKKTYDFTRAENCIKEVDKLTGRSKVLEDGGEVKLRQEEKKKIDWSNKLYLAPLTTVGNLPFRRICKEFGADVTCGEMAMASSLLQGRPQEWALVKRHGSEDLFGVQICGGNMPLMTRCAQVLQDTAEIDFIDINMGCPLDFIYEQGCGSGLLNRRRNMESVVKSLSSLLDIPLTVKTRTGVTTNKNIAHNLMPLFKESGVSLVTIHGRSREQRYIRNADWKYIEDCAAAASPMPVFGNGDILSFDDYEAFRSQAPSVQGVMIGRGSLIKPWIFEEIKERRHIDKSSSERLEMLKKYVNYGLEHWGSDTRGVETTRRFLLEWLSFLYRYIPVGLLVSPPQRMNQRPPFYHGRNELETLMASPNCTDWVKISEMLLGPVPEGFTFLPKHKANSWS